MKTVLAILTFAVIFLPSTSASAHHEWERWPTTNGNLRLEVGSNLDARWQPHLEQAVADWSTTAHGNPVRLTIVPGAGNPDCGFVTGRIEVCNWNLGKSFGMSGFTDVQVDENGMVTAMRVVLNDAEFPIEENSPINIEDRQLMMCHELGHALGLAHVDETGASFGTCMDYSGDKWYPNQHDFEQLVRAYGRYRPWSWYSVRVGQVTAR